MSNSKSLMLKKNQHWSPITSATLCSFVLTHVVWLSRTVNSNLQLLARRQCDKKHLVRHDTDSFSRCYTCVFIRLRKDLSLFEIVGLLAVIICHGKCFTDWEHKLTFWLWELLNKKWPLCIPLGRRRNCWPIVLILFYVVGCRRAVPWRYNSALSLVMSCQVDFSSVRTRCTFSRWKISRSANKKENVNNGIECLWNTKRNLLSATVDACSFFVENADAYYRKYATERVAFVTRNSLLQSFLLCCTTPHVLENS